MIANCELRIANFFRLLRKCARRSDTLRNSEGDARPGVLKIQNSKFKIRNLFAVLLFLLTSCEYQTIQGGPGAPASTQKGAAARPSATPLKAAVPNDSAAQANAIQCRLADLTPTATWSQSDKGLAGVLTLTNYWKTACTLRGQPELGIMDERGVNFPLSITAPPENVLQPASWAFKSGATGTVRFTWRNWCGPVPVGTLRITVAMPTQAGPTLFVDVEDPNGRPLLNTPRCENDKQPSTLTVEGLRMSN